MPQIIWHGHACFEITDDLTIVTDPHDGKSIGIETPMVKGDIILVSHDHYDHNSVRTVEKKDSVVVRDAGKKNVKGVEIEGIESFHDEVKGAKRGKNIIFKFKVDDITFCHLGDLGHIPDEEILDKIGEVDILFIPVGGVYTLDADSAWETANLIKSRIIVPMHYKIQGLSLPISDVDPFLAKNKFKVIHVGNQIDIEKEDLPSEREIWVFSL
ncbi:MAG TPA: Zn-dependent hydrolase [Thermoplasmatales archaeon]|nr:MBL fold metallo-hydrolase [Thermoplasmata archaeon]HHF59084.1 Zn-dependent hydrolase [Thermoplasmatales archaeon]